MVDMSQYLDLRQDFWKQSWEKALTYDDYLAASEEKHAQRWREQEKNVQLTGAQRELVESFVRRMNLIVVSGVWCGDCVRQGPIYRAFEQANDRIQFRYVDRDECPEVMDELRVTGAKKVPVVVCLSEDFLEAGRVGDRMLSIYRRKALNELGAACPVGFGDSHPDELAEEVQEWMDFMERWHLLLRLSPPLRARHGD
jgi:thiol-disulfide isomerase/thioredoxin